MAEGPNDVFICYKCSRLCVKSIEEEADRLGKPLPQ